ncbi:MAG: alcohol dehydrogenase catalytic domain-containing protein [Anaerolineales bacterium]|jgi:L-iditol 2-dehydrogenase
MKAAFLYGPEDVRIEETEIPEIQPGEALVRVHVIGICPSDVRCAKREKEVFPLGEGSRGLSGHEWAGEIAEISGNAPGIQVGDRVVADVINACGVCKFCRLGLMNLCIEKSYNIGGFAEYVVVPCSHLLKIPDNVSYESAFMTEPVSCCMHAIRRTPVELGDLMLVIGDGPLGMVHLQLGKSSGAKVIVSGHHDHRLEMAHNFGADLVVNSLKKDLTELVKRETEGYGADLVMVAVGGDEPIQEAVNACRLNGWINLFAGTYPRTTVELDPNELHYGQYFITGSFDSLREDYHRTLQAFSMGYVDVEPLISHRLPLEELKDGFEILKKRQGVKLIIEM